MVNTYICTMYKNAQATGSFVPQTVSFSNMYLFPRLSIVFIIGQIFVNYKTESNRIEVSD